MVDEFLNHRVEPAVIRDAGRDLAARFAADLPDVILTAEASGIPPALATAFELDVPVIYAKKYLGTGDRYSFAREVVSPTKGVEYRVEVARHVIPPGSRVLIVDDFLSGGRTAEALGEIVVESGGEVIGYGFVIEKAYAGGRDRLARHGWRIESIATVRSVIGGVARIEAT